MIVRKEGKSRTKDCGTNGMGIIYLLEMSELAQPYPTYRSRSKTKQVL